MAKLYYPPAFSFVFRNIGNSKANRRDSVRVRELRNSTGPASYTAGGYSAARLRHERVLFERAERRYVQRMYAGSMLASTSYRVRSVTLGVSGFAEEVEG